MGVVTETGDETGNVKSRLSSDDGEDSVMVCMECSIKASRVGGVGEHNG